MIHLFVSVLGQSGSRWSVGGAFARDNGTACSDRGGYTASCTLLPDVNGRSMSEWRDVRVVEGARLESVRETRLRSPEMSATTPYASYVAANLLILPTKLRRP